MIPFNPTVFKEKNYYATDNYGKFVLEPLERGFGQTLGNSFRRLLLSALPGASVFAITIDGARHEFATLPGVVEDVTMITLNLKQLILKIEDIDTTIKRLEVDVVGPAVVTGADITLPYGVEVISKDLVIANVAEGGHLKMTIFARNGRGYVTSESNKAERQKVGGAIGVIATDSNYSPVTKVNYTVSNTRVGHDENYDRLTLEVWTNGSITPQAAVALSAKILIEHYKPFLDLEEATVDVEVFAEQEAQAPAQMEDKKIEELDISVRSYNCLKRAGIQTVLELASKTEEEILKVRALGKKSFKEIKDKLKELGLNFRGSVE
ncbi:MAG TPA: DNA-directed RNA polymerase subunit alpha [Bacilli bacterium]|nr:DNA-directed RNA polymerase subunit alpha [Bacilli bacterium]HQB96944.1 DNA-directed RNA polymerase subunit alpha [Bacilli bacterium]